MSKRAALYARQSVDVAEGIEQQVARCRALAEGRGWSVVDIYRDNATSASKARGLSTGWGRMLASARAGELDVVVAVDIDRLLRGMGDLIALSEAHLAVATVDGEIDLTSADGEFRATMLTGLARFEVRRKSERRERMNDARRVRGLPNAGRVPFGYRWVRAHERGPDDVPWTVDAGQAAVVRRAYSLLLGGRTLGAICADLNAAGSRTTSGTLWRATTLRRTLLSPAYAARLPASTRGLPHYRVEDVDPETCVPGAWPALVDVETWMAARALLLVPSRRTNTGTARKHLLGGLAVCDECGEPVRSCVTRERSRGYRCRSQRHFQRRADLIDQVVETAVIRRLASPEMRRHLASAESPDAGPLRAERATLAGRISGLAALYADGTLDGDHVRRAKADLSARLRDVDLRLARLARHDTLTDLIQASDVRAGWCDLTLHAKRAVIAAVCSVRIQPSGLGVRASADRPFVIIEWHDEVARLVVGADLRGGNQRLPLGVRSAVVSAVLTAPRAHLRAAGPLAVSLRPEHMPTRGGRIDLQVAAALREEAGRRWDRLSDDDRWNVATTLLDLTAPPGQVHRVAVSLCDEA